MRATEQNNDGWFTRERILVVVLAAITILVFYLCYLITLPFVPALAWALAIAVAAHPLHEWLRRHLKSASFSAAIAVVVVTVTILTPAVFVVHRVSKDGIATAEKLRGVLEEGRWRDFAERNKLLGSMVGWAEREAKDGGQIQRAAEGILGGAKSVVSGTFYAVTGLLITVFLLFYFFRDKDRILGALQRALPLSPRESEGVFRKVRDTIYAIVNGSVVLALLQGVLGGLMFWILGVPSPLLWGTIMAVLAVLPVLGAAMVWVPAAVYLALFEGSWEKALVLTAWGLIVVSMIDNILYPVFVKDKLRLHTVPVFISVIGGLAVFGAAGVVLGPVVLALAVGLTDIWGRRMSSGEAVEDGKDALQAAPGKARASRKQTG
jgi:predicted PurR-regulated permease PerM